MFGIGGTELLLILLVALLVLGPKSIPQIARTLGKALREFRQVSSEFQHTLNTEITFEEHEKKVKAGNTVSSVKNNVDNNETTISESPLSTGNTLSTSFVSSNDKDDGKHSLNKEQAEKASI